MIAVLQRHAIICVIADFVNLKETEMQEIMTEPLNCLFTYGCVRVLCESRSVASALRLRSCLTPPSLISSLFVDHFGQ